MRRGTTPIFSFVFNLNYLVVFSPFTVFEVLNPDELYSYSALLKFFIYVSLFPLMCSPTLKTNYAILPTGIISIKQILFEHI